MSYYSNYGNAERVMDAALIELDRAENVRKGHEPDCVIRAGYGICNCAAIKRNRAEQSSERSGEA